MTEFYKIAVSLLPVFAFLIALIYLDSFKLVTLRSVLVTVGIGAGSALLAMLVNGELIDRIAISSHGFSRYIAPVVEESLKAVYLIFLIRLRRVGFLVDTVIFAFAIGAGFAFVENVYYLRSLESSNILVWIVRGFGTAAVHGATMIIFGIIYKTLSDRNQSFGIIVTLSAWVAAVSIHSLFNHFILPPLLSTLVVLVTLPLLVVFIFNKSEQATRNWLGSGWDTDIDLLQSITSGELSETRVGKYLNDISDKFPGPVVADMLCMLRLNLELALAAKGLLMAREAGVDLPADPEVKAKFAELKFLQRSIGKTGLLALQPFLYTSSHDLWQRYMLDR